MSSTSFFLPSRWLSLLCVLVVGGPAALAQVSFGVAAGANFSSVQDIRQTNTSLDGSTGWHAGAHLNIGAGPFSARLSGTYVEAGTFTLLEALDRNGSTVGTFADGDLALRYAVLSLDTRYEITAPFVQPYGFIGPELRFPLGEAGDDLRDAVKTVGVGMNVGGGVEIPSPIGTSLFVELRYAFDASGITDAFEAEISQTVRVPVEEVRVSPFMIRVGLDF